MEPAEPPAPQPASVLITRHLTTLESSHGQTMTEMAFILAFIVLVVVIVIPLLGTETTQLYNDVVNGFGG